MVPSIESMIQDVPRNPSTIVLPHPIRSVALPSFTRVLRACALLCLLCYRFTMGRRDGWPEQLAFVPLKGSTTILTRLTKTPG